jgi:DNA-binding HxlR family transcriptional regulator
MKPPFQPSDAAVHLIDGACAVEHAIGLVGGKWKLLLIRLLLYQGPQRFNELLEGISGISAKVLTENLRQLQAQRIVVHAGDDDAAQRRYALTESGQRLMPLLHGLGEWATAHASG